MCSKIALVVGGSRGIGKAIALKLAKSGCDILLSYKSNDAEAEKTKTEILSLGKSCFLLKFDVGNFDETKKILSDIAKKMLPDIIIFNSGIAKDNLMAFMTREQWQSVLNTNLDGFFNVINLLLFDMIARKSGRIIAISSTSGEVGQAGQVNYSASKAGLIGAVKALAREVGKKNILVNCVSPGVVETEMTQDLPKELILPLIPLKRYGTVDEIASVVNFLATEENMYIHGQVIPVNGGLSI